MSTARRLTWMITPVLFSLPHRPPRTYRACRRPVRRARLGRCDLYYPHLLLVRVVFLSFRSHLPPPSTPYSSSLFLFNTNTTPTPTLHQSNLPHLTPSSPMSHRSSHLIYYTRYLYLPRSVLVSFPYGRTHMLISSFSLSSPPLPYGLPLAPMCWYDWYGPVVDGRFVCSHGLFLRASRAVYIDTAAPDSDADVARECLFNLNGRLQRIRNRVN